MENTRGQQKEWEAQVAKADGNGQGQCADDDFSVAADVRKVL